jgi:hypothetical protein
MGERMQDWLDAVRELLTNAKGAIAALVALLVAIFALRRFLPRRGAPTAGASTNPPDVIDLTNTKADDATQSKGSGGHA